LKETNDIYNLIPEKQRDKMEAMLSSKMFTLTEQLGSENKNQGERIKLTAEQIKMLQTIIANEIKKMEQEAAEENQNKSKKVFNEKINSKNNFTGYTHYQIIEEIQEPIDTVMLAQAKQISKNIVHNLGFLDSKYSRLNESYELTEGELDEDELYSIGLGNKFLFQDIEEIPAYNLDFGILLDESGSMNSKIREAKLAVLSLLLALKDNKHINLFVYGHTANEGEYSFGSSSNRSAIQIYKYFNTLERYTDWRNIFSADSRSNNADGFAIEKMGEIMKKSESRNKILIVVSDGQPNASGYGGDEAIAHTRSVVQQLEADGFTVIQICVDNVEASPRMFTHFVPYESDGKFFNNLKAILLQKLIQFADAV
jgi:nitric oxide reductase activation protein